MKKIGVIGSRERQDKDHIEAVLNKKLSRVGCFELITGGARGVDTIVTEWAYNNHVPVTTIRPLYKHKKIYYLYRNIEILTLADELIVFWDGKSRGTKFVLDYVKQRTPYKPVTLDLRDNHQARL